MQFSLATCSFVETNRRCGSMLTMPPSLFRFRGSRVCLSLPRCPILGERYNSRIALDGNVSYWWGNDAAVTGWNAPLQRLGVPVLPYLIDVDNSTQMHMVYSNSTAVVADAVAIAKHYGFQGWFIDYEYVFLVGVFTRVLVFSSPLDVAFCPSTQSPVRCDGVSF